MAEVTRKLQLIGAIWGALADLKNAKKGQLLKVSGVNDKGEITALETVELSDNGIESMKKDIADLKKFHPIAVSNVTNNVQTVELGRTIDAVTVTWVLNKAPVSQTVDGKAVETDARSTVIPGPFTSGKSFAVTATDAEGNTAKGSTAINFYNGVYYGALTATVMPDRATILSLSKKLQNGLGVTFTFTPGNGKRPSFACPVRYGKPKFTIGPNEYEWTPLGTVNFENASGYTEEYAVYQHPQDVADSISIVVAKGG